MKKQGIKTHLNEYSIYNKRVTTINHYENIREKITEHMIETDKIAKEIREKLKNIILK